MVASKGPTGRHMEFENGQLVVPDDPIIPCIEGGWDRGELFAFGPRRDEH